ncbi:MAG: class B sortase [Clostridia bacterium]|nr:class B sortase [Clostridia bacterium]
MKKNTNEKSNIPESFGYSLKHITKDDIEEKLPPDKREIAMKKRRNIISRILLVIFSCIFIWSAYSIASKLIQYKKSEDFYNGLISDFEDNEKLLAADNGDSPTPKFGSGYQGDSSSYNRIFLRMKKRLEELQKINPDVCGWIIIPGTKHINYPLLQSTDNSYYLNHEYKGGYLAAGSIFVDYNCDRDFNGNHNTVIYGHNMQNGMMFSELIDYLDESFFRENEYIYIYTMQGVYTYRVFSVYKTDYRYKYIQTYFADHSEFVEFAKEMQANSMYFRDGIAFDENSRIVTLSTCTNARQTDRYTVHALLTEAYNE